MKPEKQVSLEDTAIKRYTVQSTCFGKVRGEEIKCAADKGANQKKFIF